MKDGGVVPIAHFVPGRGPSEPGLLDGLLPPWPAGVAEAFIEAYSAPGDLLLIPFASSITPLAEGYALGRRTIAATSNPIPYAALRHRFDQEDPASLRRLLARLGESAKRDVPLRRALQQLYRSRCPACDGEVTVRYFLWSREPAEPRQKWLCCSTCGAEGLFDTDKEDLQVLAGLEPRGLHYHFLLDRLASPEGAHRARARELMQLYTPRTLQAVADLIIKGEAVLSDEEQQAFKRLLLHCLGRASGVFGGLETVTLPRRLALPARFVEINLWHLLETYVAGLQPQPALPAVYEPAAVLEADEKRPALLHLGSRRLARMLPEASVKLVITAPPPIDGVFWNLAYLWAGWLYGVGERSPLRALASRRWPDWPWYLSAMARNLQTLRPVLSPDARWVFLFTSSALPLTASLTMAALAAGYEVESWQCCDGEAQQLTLRLVTTSRPVYALDPQLLEVRLVAAGREGALQAVTNRGEPLPDAELRFGAWRYCLKEDLPAAMVRSLPPETGVSFATRALEEGLQEARSAGLQGIFGEGVEPVAWWLAHPSAVLENPLSERVEATIRRALQEAQTVSEAEMERTIYRRFSGDRTPPAGLVRSCLEAYGEPVAEGLWRRAEEDAPERVAQRFIEQVVRLGERLSFDVQAAPQEVRWSEAGEDWAVFSLLFAADVGRFLPGRAPPMPKARWRNLVIPASRAPLWLFKMAAFPWLPQLLADGGWTFVKLEYLLMLAEQPNPNRHDLKTIVGLEPLVERSGQMPLF